MTKLRPRFVDVVLVIWTFGVFFFGINQRFLSVRVENYNIGGDTQNIFKIKEDDTAAYLRPILQPNCEGKDDNSTLEGIRFCFHVKTNDVTERNHKIDYASNNLRIRFAGNKTMFKAEISCLKNRSWSAPSIATCT